MNTKLLLSLLVTCLLVCTSTNAQSYELQCQLTVEQVQLSQTWDIDDPNSEFTMNYAEILFAEINSIYTKMNNGQSNELQEHKDAIEATLLLADNLGMNYTMFQDDLDIIETLN